MDPLRVEGGFASAAAIVFECLPYVCATLLLQRWPLLRSRELLAYAGCGCTATASARSLPAAIATALLFGPFVALARLVAACSIAHVRRHVHYRHDATLAGELQALAPSAAIAAIAATAASTLQTGSWPPFVAWIAGAALGALAPPCALGSVALAASLHTTSPALATGVLCSAGIFELRPLRDRSPRDGDAMSYILLALGCALVACEGGASLINPRIAVAVGACVPICGYAAWTTQVRRNHAATALCTALLVATVLDAPAPVYRASETTLADAFAGEHLSFTGVYVVNGTHAALVRYAMTCCRADAAPVVVLLSRTCAIRDGTWARAEGKLERSGDRLVLAVRTIQRITTPRDPFVYR
jgi:hypothetical protein